MSFTKHVIICQWTETLLLGLIDMLSTYNDSKHVCQSNSAVVFVFVLNLPVKIVVNLTTLHE